MDPVEAVDVIILGHRGLPMARVRLQGDLVAGLGDFLDRAEKIRPDASIADVLRSIFELGSRKLNGNLARGILKSSD